MSDIGKRALERYKENKKNMEESKKPKIKFKLKPKSKRDPKNDFSEKERLYIYLRDKGFCQIKKKCDGKKKLALDNFHIDHKTPHSRGGNTDIDNAQLSCPACNLDKSDKII